MSSKCLKTLSQIRRPGTYNINGSWTVGAVQLRSVKASLLLVLAAYVEVLSYANPFLFLRKQNIFVLKIVSLDAPLCY